MTLGVSAGDRATADQYNALVPLFLRQASDQTISDATATDHNTFAGISIGAGETWQVDVYLDVNGNETSDIRILWASTGTVVGGNRHMKAMGTDATQAGTAESINTQCRAFTSSTASGVTDHSSNRGSMEEHFLVDGGASGGTITMRWSQNSASGGSATIYAGSWLVARRLS